MPKYTESQLQDIIQYLPKRLIRAMFIHHRMTAVEFTDLQGFMTKVQNTPEWQEMIALHEFMLSDTDNANAVWSALTERDFSPRDPAAYDKRINGLININHGIVPFNAFRSKYLLSVDYSADTPQKRYHELSIYDDIDCYLTFSEMRGNTVKRLKGMQADDAALFEQNPINNVLSANREHVLRVLLRCSDLKTQWAHTLSMILKPEVRSGVDMTILMEAAFYNDVDMVGILLANGVDVDVRRNMVIQDTAISIALYYRRAEAANLILDKCPAIMLEKNPVGFAQKSILLWALKYKHHKIVSYMLRHNITVNECEDNGRTPLMYAAFYGDIEVISRLIELGAVPDMKDREGYKASDYARGGKQTEAMNFLLSKEAPVPAPAVAMPLPAPAVAMPLPAPAVAMPLRFRVAQADVAGLVGEQIIAVAQRLRASCFIL